MKNKYEDKDIENEINSFIDLVLHLDSYLFKDKTGLENLKNKISKINLGPNSQKLIYEIIESEKVSHYICNNEKIKEIRNNRGIMKAINEIFKKEKGNKETKHNIRNINSYSFNQFGLSTCQAFYNSEAEFYFLKNFIHTKILNLIKSCFELQFDKNKDKVIKIKNNNNNSSKNKTKFILISHSCLRNAKLINEYLNKNKNLSLNNHYLKLSGLKLLNPTNIRYLKNCLTRSQVNIYENSRVFNLYKNPRNTSDINSSDFNLNKNSSSSCDKSSNKIYDFNSMNISNDKKNFFKKKNLNLIYKNKNENKEKDYFLPILNIKQNNYYTRKLDFRRKRIPSFNSGQMELIAYNTKNNIKIKNEKTFLDECIKESYRSLIDLNDNSQSKCFVDYSKSSITSEKIPGKKEEASKKEKLIFPGFEYRNIFKYTFNGKLPRHNKKIIL